MDVLNWILLSIGGICFALVLLLLWLGPPSRHHSTLLQMLPSKPPLTHDDTDEAAKTEKSLTGSRIALVPVELRRQVDRR